MNTETGEIKRFTAEDVIPSNFIEIKEKQMTEKQKELMQVSKHDSLSILGRLFTGSRAERRRQAKEFKRSKK